jgi:hypothetical protein
MKLVKISNWTPESDIKKSLQDLDTDLKNIMLFSAGRVRFGTGVDGARGENISGEFQVFTAGSADAENTIAHTLGSVPIGYLVVKQSKAGSLYSGSTAWSSTNIYLKCSVASVVFTIFLLK